MSQQEQDSSRHHASRNRRRSRSPRRRSRSLERHRRHTDSRNSSPSTRYRSSTHEHDDRRERSRQHRRDHSVEEVWVHDRYVPDEEQDEGLRYEQPREGSRREQEGRHERRRHDEEEDHRHRASSRRYRQRSAYESQLDEGLGGAQGGGDEGEYFPPGGRFGGWEDDDAAPCSTVYVRGLPSRAVEDDLLQALADVHGVQSVRFLRDRDTGAFRGYGFIEFHTTESATALLHQQRSHPLVLHGARLALAYAKTGGAGGYRGDGYGHRGDYGGPSATSSHGDPPGGDGGSSSHTPKDWVCERCKAINFARRFECFKCCTARPPPESRITVDADAPTNIVKVTGFDAYSTTNEHLYYLAAAVAPVQEVRMVRDKVTGAPRSLAFLHCRNVDDAGRLVQRLHGAVLEGQTAPLHATFGLDKGAVAAGVGEEEGPTVPEAVLAAQAMSAYSSWQPKEYGAEDSNAAVANQDQPTAGTCSEQATEQAANGYQYDAASGYYYDAASGLYYDANTGLFYDSNKASWCRYDEETQTYEPVWDGDEERGASRKQPGEEAKADAPKPKRGAVIGSAPQLNPEGVRAALEAAEVKVQQQQAQAKQVQGVVRGGKGKWAAKKG